MQKTPGGIAARAGRWSARHKKTAIAGWLVFVVVALMAGNMTGTKRPTDADKFDGESRTAQQIITDAGFSDAAGEMVLVQSSKLTAKDAAFKSAVKDVKRAVAGQPIVTNVKAPSAVSKDGHSALVQFDVKGDPDTAQDRIEPVVAAVNHVAEAHSDVAIGEFGTASVTKELTDSQSAEQNRSQMLSMGVTLLILLITFGALLAAAVPVVLALTAVIGTVGLVGIASQLVPADSVTVQVITLVGLAVGVDYSLFYIRREREERAAGRSKLEAARHGRGHVRPRGAHLRPHRDDRDGRHVPHRQRHVHGHGPRHDPRRRGRGARLAHRPARDPRRVRRPHQQGPDPAAAAPQRGA